MPTTKQDSDFADLMKDNVDEVKMSKTALDEAVSWIGDNLDPDDVFNEKSLSAWAESNGYVKE
jgi:hypothetical protein